MSFKDELKITRKAIKNYENVLDYDNYVAVEFSSAKNKHRKDKVLYHLRAIYPLFLSIALASGLVTLFTRTVLKRNLSTVEKVDTLGNSTSYSKYTNEYDNSANKLLNFSKWKLNENNEYVRTVKSYNINNYNSEVIKNILANEDTIYTLEDMFGKPTSTYEEVADSLSEEELNKPEYIEAVTYSKDKDDYIITKMDASDKILYAIMFSVIAAGLTSIYNLSRFDIWNYENALLSIEENYCEELKRLDEKRKTLKK